MMAQASPHILALTSELPWPLNTGGHLRTFHLLRALATRFPVRLVAGVRPGQADEALAVFRPLGISLRAVPLPERSWIGELPRLTRATLGGEPYVLFQRHGWRAMWRVLEEEIERDRPSVFYLDHLDSFLFAKVRRGVPCLVDLHNVYSILVERAAREQRTVWARWYLRREARLLAGMERQAARQADGLMTVSTQEHDHFRALGAEHVSVVPNGVDCDAYEDLPVGRRASTSPVILYVGALSWAPNVAAAKFLATVVLPAVRLRVPGAQLKVVGRQPTAEALALAKLEGVSVLGDVEDVRPYLGEASVLAVPLEAGGGTRLKILEAFAAGLPVVSTPVGCEGLDAENGRHLVVAGKDTFSESVAAILADPAAAVALAREGRTLARSTYDWSVVGHAAIAAVVQLLL